MNQSQLERAVCRATGESREVIRRLGFQLVNVPRYQRPGQVHTRRWHGWRPVAVRS